jgi:hypothetical protein
VHCTSRSPPSTRCTAECTFANMHACLSTLAAPHRAVTSTMASHHIVSSILTLWPQASPPTPTPSLRTHPRLLLMYYGMP